jgi:hypothetical protein
MGLIGRRYSTKTGRAYLGTVPYKKPVMRICQAISSETGHNRTLLDQKVLLPPKIKPIYPQQNSPGIDF